MYKIIVHILIELQYRIHKHQPYKKFISDVSRFIYSLM